MNTSSSSVRLLLSSKPLRMFVFFLRKKPFFLGDVAKTNMNSRGRAFPSLALSWMDKLFLKG